MKWFALIAVVLMAGCSTGSQVPTQPLTQHLSFSGHKAAAADGRVFNYGHARNAVAGQFVSTATFTGFSFPDYSVGLMLSDTITTYAYGNLVDYVDANLDLPSAEFQWGQGGGCFQAFSYTQDNSFNDRKCRLLVPEADGLSWVLGCADYRTCDPAGTLFDVRGVSWHGEAIPDPQPTDRNVVYSYHGGTLILNELVGSEANALHLYLPGGAEVRIGHIQGE